MPSLSLRACASSASLDSDRPPPMIQSTSRPSTASSSSSASRPPLGRKSQVSLRTLFRFLKPRPEQEPLSLVSLGGESDLVPADPDSHLLPLVLPARTSSGRGGAGNIRRRSTAPVASASASFHRPSSTASLASSSASALSDPFDDDARSVTRGRELHVPSSHRTSSSGRGGNGNIKRLRSRSNVSSDLELAKLPQTSSILNRYETGISDYERALIAESARRRMSKGEGRGGMGNIRNSQQSAKRKPAPALPPPVGLPLTALDAVPPLPRRKSEVSFASEGSFLPPDRGSTYDVETVPPPRRRPRSVPPRGRAVPFLQRELRPRPSVPPAGDLPPVPTLPTDDLSEPVSGHESNSQPAPPADGERPKLKIAVDLEPRPSDTRAPPSPGAHPGFDPDIAFDEYIVRLSRRHAHARSRMQSLSESSHGLRSHAALPIGRHRATSSEASHRVRRPHTAPQPVRRDWSAPPVDIHPIEEQPRVWPVTVFIPEADPNTLAEEYEAGADDLDEWISCHTPDNMRDGDSERLAPCFEADDDDEEVDGVLDVDWAPTRSLETVDEAREHEEQN